MPLMSASSASAVFCRQLLLRRAVADAAVHTPHRVLEVTKRRLQIHDACYVITLTFQNGQYYTSIRNFCWRARGSSWHVAYDVGQMAVAVGTAVVRPCRSRRCRRRGQMAVAVGTAVVHPCRSRRCRRRGDTEEVLCCLGTRCNELAKDFTCGGPSAIHGRNPSAESKAVRSAKNQKGYGESRPRPQPTRPPAERASKRPQNEEPPTWPQKSHPRGHVHDAMKRRATHVATKGAPLSAIRCIATTGIRSKDHRDPLKETRGPPSAQCFF